MCLQVGCFGAADTRPSDVGQMPALLWLASPVGRRVRPGDRKYVDPPQNVSDVIDEGR